MLKHIQEILTLVTVIKRKAAIDDEGWSNNPDILKIFDMFELYPTEWWQYPAAVFYLTHKEKNGFEEAFLAFLRKLFTEMLRIYIVSPNVSSIKGGIMKLNVASISTMHPIFDFRKFDVFEDAFDKSIVRPHNKIRRVILAAISYDEAGQDSLLPPKWEIEHIFPQHWQANYDLGGFTKEGLAETIEEIGNLMPLEKKLNIGASDGYYAKKRDEYRKSKIEVARRMAERTSWSADNIHERNVRIVDKLKAIFTRWDAQYEEL